MSAPERGIATSANVSGRATDMGGVLGRCCEWSNACPRATPCSRSRRRGRSRWAEGYRSPRAGGNGGHRAAGHRRRADQAARPQGLGRWGHARPLARDRTQLRRARDDMVPAVVMSRRRLIRGVRSLDHRAVEAARPIVRQCREPTREVLICHSRYSCGILLRMGPRLLGRCWNSGGMLRISLTTDWNLGTFHVR